MQYRVCSFLSAVKSVQYLVCPLEVPVYQYMDSGSGLLAAEQSFKTGAHLNYALNIYIVSIYFQ